MYKLKNTARISSRIFPLVLILLVYGCGQNAVYTINGVISKPNEFIQLNPGETIIVSGDNSYAEIIIVKGGVYVNCGSAEICNVEIVPVNNNLKANL